MKESEKIVLQAEEKGKLAAKQQEEVDLRAGQIDKLQQEMGFFESERDKYLKEQSDLIKRAQEAAAQEEHEKERQREKTAFDIARAMENNS